MSAEVMLYDPGARRQKVISFPHGSLFLWDQCFGILVHTRKESSYPEAAVLERPCGEKRPHREMNRASPSYLHLSSLATSEQGL